MNSGLLAGDIVFSKTVLDGAPNPTFDQLNPATMDDFQVLAAYGQGYPYNLQRRGYRPWFHVAICVEGGDSPRVVGYESDGYSPRLNPGGQFGPIIEVELVEPLQQSMSSSGQYEFVVQALRHDSAGKSIAAAARAQLKPELEYNVNGLAAFGLGVVGRMFPNGLLRQKLLEEARGAEFFARQNDGANQESCVTATAKAIENVIGPLVFSEPPIPGSLASRINQPVASVIEESLETLRHGPFVVDLEASVVSAVNWMAWELVPEGELPEDMSGVHDLDIVNDMLDAFPEGFNPDPGQIPSGLREDAPTLYLRNPDRSGNMGLITATIEKSLAQLGSPQQLRQKGQTLQGQLTTSDSLTATPAMLWDTLESRKDFSEV